jgi:hypothetical protein
MLKQSTTTAALSSATSVGGQRETGFRKARSGLGSKTDHIKEYTRRTNYSTHTIAKTSDALLKRPGRKK